MTRFVLWILLALETLFLVGLRLWLGSMDQRFVYGFACGTIVFLTLFALIETFDRVGGRTG